MNTQYITTFVIVTRAKYQIYFKPFSVHVTDRDKHNINFIVNNICFEMEERPKCSGSLLGALTFFL